jgi:hypothetical protein
MPKPPPVPATYLRLAHYCVRLQSGAALLLVAARVFTLFFRHSGTDPVLASGITENMSTSPWSALLLLTWAFLSPRDPADGEARVWVLACQGFAILAVGLLGLSVVTMLDAVRRVGKEPPLLLLRSLRLPHHPCEPTSCFQSQQARELWTLLRGLALQAMLLLLWWGIVM